MSLNVNIESSARRLFPNLTTERAIVELLLERAQKNLIKYQMMARQFKAKYGREFEEFRKMILSGQPTLALNKITSTGNWLSQGLPICRPRSSGSRH